MKDIFIVIGMVMEMILVLIKRAYWFLLRNILWVVVLGWCVVAVIHFFAPKPIVIEGAHWENPQTGV